MKKLTSYQESQLLHIHFNGELQYTTENGTRVPAKAWRTMIDTLTNNGLVVFKNGAKLTAKGRAYLDQQHESAAR